MALLSRFVVERDIPGVGAWGREALQATAAKSNEVLRQLAPEIQWIESAIAGDKTFCTYLASGAAVIREHSQRSGFPITAITEIRRRIDPTSESGEGR